MTRLARLLGAVLLLWPAAAVAIAPVPDFADPALERRYLDLVHDLRCLVCQNQSVADSNAPLARDLREKVSELLRAGHDDRQVIDFVTSRYGDFILLTPPLRATTVLLFLAPVVILIGGAGLVLLVARRQRPATPPGAADLARARERLDDGRR